MVVRDNTYNTILKLMQERQEILDRIGQHNSSSLQVTVEDMFTKMLLLYTASHCEKLIHDLVIDLYKYQYDDECILTEFVENQALNRQYHRMFNWKSNNANFFFQLFGKDFKEHMKNKVKKDVDLQNNSAAFVNLGHLRNEAVHENLTMYSLGDKNASDIIRLYNQACQFVDSISSEMRDFIVKKDETVSN